MSRNGKLGFTKHLRHNQTPAEEILWNKLRGRRLNNYKFRRQVLIDRFTVDFICESQKLIVEVDGKSHVNNAAYDAERTQVLEHCGYTVLRVWNPDVYEELDAVIHLIARTLENAKP